MSYLIIWCNFWHTGERALGKRERDECRAVLAQVLVDVLEGVDLVAGEEQPLRRRQKKKILFLQLWQTWDHIHKRSYTNLTKIS